MESYRQSRLTLSLNYPRRRQPWGRGDRSLTKLAPLRTQAFNGQIDSACNGPVGSYSCEPKPNSQARIKAYKLHGKHSVVTSEYHSITQCCAQTSSHPYSADNLTAGADTESLWLALVKMILPEGGRNSLWDNVVHKLNASSVALPTHCHRFRRCRCLPVPWESHRLNTNRHTYHALTLLCIIASEATTRHCAKASGISCRPPSTDEGAFATRSAVENLCYDNPRYYSGRGGTRIYTCSCNTSTTPFRFLLPDHSSCHEYGIAYKVYLYQRKQRYFLGGTSSRKYIDEPKGASPPQSCGSAAILAMRNARSLAPTSPETEVVGTPTSAVFAALTRPPFNLLFHYCYYV